ITWRMHASAQLKLIISGGFSAPYQQLLPEFERKSGTKVTTGSGASQGTGPQTIGAQLARGVAADVVILSREGLSELIAANRIAAGTDGDLAQVPLGVAVRAGAARPDVSTVEAFKRTLTNAKAVAMPGSTSGIYLMNDLFPRLGIAEKVNVKVAARGTGVVALVAAGAAGLGVTPVSDVLNAAGVDFTGTMPVEIQVVQVCAPAPVAGSKEPDAARGLIEF